MRGEREAPRRGGAELSESGRSLSRSAAAKFPLSTFDDYDLNNHATSSYFKFQGDL